jgi:CheY-like chemotaxis protein
MKNILVVDDEHAIRQILNLTLKQAGYVVSEACNGNAASQVLEQSLPNLLITDLSMPEKEGTELIQEVRALYPDIPIIAMSGAQIDKTEINLKMADLPGIDYLLAKPFSLNALLQTVKQALGDWNPGS